METKTTNDKGCTKMMISYVVQGNIKSFIMKYKQRKLYSSTVKLLPCNNSSTLEENILYFILCISIIPMATNLSNLMQYSRKLFHPVLIKMRSVTV